MENINQVINKTIIDGRIVSDITFATRLISFLNNIQVNDGCSDDELTYLKNVANNLLKLQIATVENVNELNYLKRIHKENFNIN
jgi:hypothetical protein